MPTNHKNYYAHHLLILIGVIIALGCSRTIQKTEANEVDIKKDDTSNWKTYINTKFDYQINYPFDIQTNQDQEAIQVIFYKNSNADFDERDINYIVINAFFNPDTLPPQEYLKNNYEKWLGSPSSYSDLIIEPIEFNGIRAISFATATDKFIMFGKGKYLFSIRGTDAKVISTFKFMESINHIYDSDFEPYINDWKFYTNGVFSFNYPKNWNISANSKMVSVYDNSHEFSVLISIEKPSDNIYNSIYKESIKVERFNATVYIFPSEFYIPIKKDDMYYIIKGKGNLQNVKSSLYGQIIYTFYFNEVEY